MIHARAIPALITLILVMPFIKVSDYAMAQSPNLLTNPDFEDEGRWLFQDGVREIAIPPGGWFAFWRPSPPDDLLLPSNCPRRSDFGCYWARPEFRDVKASDFPNRVHSGARAVRYFTYGRMHEAGLSQAVEGIPLGVQLRFSAWLQTWMCANAPACKGGKASDAPARMHLQVGIDPWGGIDPWSSDVIWSPEGEAFDQWQRFQVEAMSEAGVATVFIRSRAEWDWPRLNNDVHIDDARLETVPSPTPVSVSATLPGVRHLATATPSVLVTHTVAAGETLGSIALAHGVSIEQIMRLNRLSPGQAIYPRQVLVIWGTEPEALPIGRSSVLTTPTGTMVTVNASPCQNPTPFLTWTLGGFALVFVAWTVIMAVRRMQDRGT